MKHINTSWDLPGIDYEWGDLLKLFLLRIMACGKEHGLFVGVFHFSLFCPHFSFLLHSEEHVLLSFASGPAVGAAFCRGGGLCVWETQK